MTGCKATQGDAEATQGDARRCKATQGDAEGRQGEVEEGSPPAHMPSFSRTWWPPVPKDSSPQMKGVKTGLPRIIKGVGEKNHRRHAGPLGVPNAPDPQKQGYAKGPL